MTLSRPVAVFGATGAQGAPVVHQLLAAGRPVRAIARTASRLQPLAARGAEVAVAELSDAEALRRALDGVSGAFVHLPFGLGHEATVEAAHAVGRALVAAGVPLTVYTTSAPVAAVPIPEPHFNVTAAAEAAVRGAGAPVVSLRPAGYLGNLSAPFCAPSVLAGELAYPLPADFRYRWVSVEDQAALAIAALARPELAGRHFAIGHALTGTELVARIGQGLGRPLRYRALTPRAFAKQLEPLLGPAAELVVDDYRVAVERADVLGLTADATQLPKALGVALTPVEQWARAQDWPGAAALAPAA